MSIALMIGTGYLFTLVPKGFLPSEDQGRFNISTEGDAGHRLRGDGSPPGAGRCDRREGAGHRRLQQQPRWVRARRRRTEYGRISIDLKPRAERTRSVDQIIADLRPKLAQVPGMRVFLINQPPINLGGQQGARSLYQFTLQDTDTAELYHWAPIFETKVREIPGFEDVSSDLQVKNPQVQVAMDRDKISALGLTVNQVETALYNAYGTRQVSQIYAPNNQYQVILQVAPEFQQDPAAMSMLYVRVLGRQPHSVEHAGHDDDRRRASHREPHRAAAVCDDFVQPEARLRARRRGQRNQDGRRPRRCRRRSRPRSRARRRRSRIR